MVDVKPTMVGRTQMGGIRCVMIDSKMRNSPFHKSMQ